MNQNIGQGDFLYRALLSLHHYHVAHADGIRESNLEAREHIRQHSLGCDAGYQRDDAGGSQQGTHGGAGCRESQRHRDDPGDRKECLADAVQHLCLSQQATGTVGFIHAAPSHVLQDPAEIHQPPGNSENQGNQHAM